MNNLVVCFPGGAGGHFIANICSAILFNKHDNILQDGSMHEQTMLYLHKFSLDGRILDRSEESYLQELQVINDLPNFEISLGHYRYIKDLVSVGKRVIYVTFDQEDKKIIYARLDKKTDILNITEYHYNAIRGVDWPTYFEFKNGNIHVELLDKKDWLADWFYDLPDNKINICEVKFKEILTGNSLYLKLTDFLNHSADYDLIDNLITNYRKLND